MSTIEVRRCLLCGEAYATTSPKRKYCCDCTKAVQAVRNSDYYKMNTEKRKEYQRKYKKRHSSKNKKSKYQVEQSYVLIVMLYFQKMI